MVEVADPPEINWQAQYLEQISARLQSLEAMRGELSGVRSEVQESRDRLGQEVRESQEKLAQSQEKLRMEMEAKYTALHGELARFRHEVWLLMGTVIGVLLLPYLRALFHVAA